MLIRPEEMKVLIEKKQVIESAHSSMKKAYEQLESDVDGAIYSAFVSGQGEGAPGAISDKTANIAASIEKKIDEESKQVQRDIKTLSYTLEGIANGYKALTKMQRLIIDLHYPTDGKRTWKEVVQKLRDQDIYFSERHIKRIHEYAVKRMIIAAQIAIETYRDVMSIMEGRGA